jgi:hypothetical protein
MAAEAGRPSGSTLVEKSMGSAIEAWTRMKPLVLSAALASAILGGAAAYLENRLGLPTTARTANAWLFRIFEVPFDAFISAPLAVAIHRLILLGETTPGIISLRRNYQWSFFAWLCLFTFIERAMSYSAASLAGIASSLILVIPFAIFSAKFAMLFPAVAIDSPSESWRARLTTSWRLMDGNFWLFIRAILIAIVPLLLVIFLSAVILMFVVRLVFSAGTGAETVRNNGIVRGVLLGIILPVSVMMAAGIASWLYAWLRDNKPA